MFCAGEQIIDPTAGYNGKFLFKPIASILLKLQQKVPIKKHYPNSDEFILFLKKNCFLPVGTDYNALISQIANGAHGVVEINRRIVPESVLKGYLIATTSHDPDINRKATVRTTIGQTGLTYSQARYLFYKMQERLISNKPKTHTQLAMIGKLSKEAPILDAKGLPVLNTGLVVKTAAFCENEFTPG